LQLPDGFYETLLKGNLVADLAEKKQERCKPGKK
jgi:hypothetical protein